MKINKSLLLICVLAVFTLFFAACGEEAEAPIDRGDAPDVPLLWQATSPGGNSIYLFGSIHIGSPSMYPLPDFVMAAFERSDYLAVEANIAIEPNFAEILTLGWLLTYEYDSSIIDDIGEELYARATELAYEHNLELEDYFLPVAWWMALSSVASDEMVFSPEYGVDLYFIELASDAGMEVLEIESLLSQWRMLARLSMPLQVAMLEAAVESLEHIPFFIRDTQNLVDAWQRGDEQTLIRARQMPVPLRTPQLMAELENSLMTQRDIQMTAVARGYMADGMNVFFVVGAAHFVGEGSIIDLLLREGYTVERIWWTE